MGDFLSDLRSVIEPAVLKRVGRKALDDDCAGVAGQLAYFILFSLFPFLIFLIALVSVAIDDPESALTTLTEQIEIFLPAEVIGLLEQFIDRTLREAAPSVLLLGVLATFWAGSAASRSLVKAADLAYEVEETRRLWKLFGISVLMIVGLALLIVALALVVFSPQTGGYIQTLTGLPDVFISSWNMARWVVAFLTITLALDILYYLAPNAEVPFRWITPGGLSATILILLSSLALNLYVSYIGRYDQLYGQVGAVIVLMLWIYVTSYMVLVGIEINAVLARIMEEKKGTGIIRSRRT